MNIFLANPLESIVGCWIVGMTAGMAGMLLQGIAPVAVVSVLAIISMVALPVGFLASIIGLFLLIGEL